MTKYLHIILVQGYYSILTIILASLLNLVTVWTLQKYFVKNPTCRHQESKELYPFSCTSFHAKPLGNEMILLLFLAKKSLNLESLGRRLGEEQMQLHRGWRRKERWMYFSLFHIFFLLLLEEDYFPISSLCDFPHELLFFFVGFLEGLPSQNACSFLWPNSSFKSIYCFS